MTTRVNNWSKSIVHWRDEDGVNVSVPFTWMLPDARKVCKLWQDGGYHDEEFV